jgi:Ser/Thr protein kinase RdoA (MazF antagonist)
LGLGGFARAVDLGGSSSLNLLVVHADRRSVVRVHRPHVTPGRLGAIHQARRALLAGGVPCAAPVPTLHGAAWLYVEGRLVEVEAYVDRDTVMDSWRRLEVGMALLARTHNLLRHVQVGGEGRRPRFANHLGGAAGRGGGGAPPRRRRGARAGGGAADHDQPRPVAGRIRLKGGFHRCGIGPCIGARVG